MKLHEALRKIFKLFGIAVIKEKRLVFLLADYKAFDDFPAMKQVMEAIVTGRYGRELCLRAADDDSADYELYTEYLRKSLVRVQRFRKEFAQYASDCISFAIGFLDSVNEPQDHGFDPRRTDIDDADDDFADAEESGTASETATAAPQDRSVVTGKGPLPAVQGGSGPDDASHDAGDLESLRKSAEHGDVKAQLALGDKYCTGDGVTRDYREAREWYLKAAEQGSAEAQNSLGHMYDAGRGVRQDYAEALRWYRKAADQGNAAAACNLGNMYYSGQGVRQSYGEAYRWYREAADLGSASAAGNLKYMQGAGLVP